ncbi:MAG: hypothetical protein HQK53_08655 [Oligoflexia bacterium]|nr:hypothetical protein [Oligoflexia bacterium]
MRNHNKKISESTVLTVLKKINYYFLYLFVLPISLTCLIPLPIINVLPLAFAQNSDTDEDTICAPSLKIQKDCEDPLTYRNIYCKYNDDKSCSPRCDTPDPKNPKQTKLQCLMGIINVIAKEKKDLNLLVTDNTGGLTSSAGDYTEGSSVLAGFENLMNSQMGMVLLYGIFLGYSIGMLIYSLFNPQCFLNSPSIWIGTLAAVISLITFVVTSKQFTELANNKKEEINQKSQKSSGVLQAEIFETLTEIYNELNRIETTKAVVFAISSALFLVAFGAVFLDTPCPPGNIVSKGDIFTTLKKLIPLILLQLASVAGSGALIKNYVTDVDNSTSWVLTTAVPAGGFILMIIDNVINQFNATSLMIVLRGLMMLSLAIVHILLACAAGAAAVDAKVKAELLTAIKDVVAGNKKCTHYKGDTHDSTGADDKNVEVDETEEFPDKDHPNFESWKRCFCYGSSGENTTNLHPNVSICVQLEASTNSGPRKVAAARSSYTRVIAEAPRLMGCAAVNGNVVSYDRECKSTKRLKISNTKLLAQLTGKASALMNTGMNMVNGLFDGSLRGNASTVSQSRNLMFDASRYAKKTLDDVNAKLKKEGKPPLNLKKFAGEMIAQVDKGLSAEDKDKIAKQFAGNTGGGASGADSQFASLTKGFGGTNAGTADGTDSAGIDKDKKKSTAPNISFQSAGGKKDDTGHKDKDPMSSFFGGQGGSDVRGAGSIENIPGGNTQPIYKSKSISGDKGKAIWDIISDRYKNSAYQKLF